MLRSTSVVITTIGASPRRFTSPVSRPTSLSPYSAQSSRNFWFDSALMGAV